MVDNTASNSYPGDKALSRKRGRLVGTAMKGPTICIPAKVPNGENCLKRKADEEEEDITTNDRRIRPRIAAYSTDEHSSDSGNLDHSSDSSDADAPTTISNTFEEEVINKVDYLSICDVQENVKPLASNVLSTSDTDEVAKQDELSKADEHSTFCDNQTQKTDEDVVVDDSCPATQDPNHIASDDDPFTSFSSSDDAPPLTQRKRELNWDAEIGSQQSVSSNSSTDSFTVNEHDEDSSNFPPVMQKGLQDPELYGTYDNLPKLRYAAIMPMKHEEDLPGLYEMKVWREMIPGRPSIIQTIKQAIIFVKLGVFANPARADPRIFTTRTIGKNRYIVWKTPGRPCMVAVTTGCCMSSNLVTGKLKYGRERGDSIYKVISLLPHTQEFERSVAFMGNVLDFQSCGAPCYSSKVLSYSTRTALHTLDLDDNSAKISQYLHEKLPSRLNAESSTSATITNNAMRSPMSIQLSLGAHDQVPIYDARFTTFTLQDNAEDMSRLPLYKTGTHDLPNGACISVGHTIGLYPSKQEGHIDLLTLNVQWVILWGVATAHLF